MAWPPAFVDESGPEALILVPTPKGVIQDLGPFLSGRLMETDLAPRSALVCRADAEGRPILLDGKIPFAFEGNVNGAVNLERFFERCLSAAGRLKHRHPSIAYGAAAPEDLLPVARFDLDRMIFTEILDRDLLERWSGETAEAVMPAPVPTPCTEVASMRHLFDLPLSVIAMDPDATMAWKAPNGQVIVRQKNPDATVLWSVEDPGFRDGVARSLGLGATEWRSVFGREGMPGWARDLEAGGEEPDGP
jgi:hypothetical protein